MTLNYKATNVIDLLAALPMLVMLETFESNQKVQYSSKV